MAPPYKFIADGLKDGEVVPFFGAAASAVCRPASESWKPGKSPFMPFGDELANALANAANYTAAHEAYKQSLVDLKSSLERMAWHCNDDRQLMLSELLRTLDDKNTHGGGEQARSALAPVLSRLDAPPDLALVASFIEAATKRASLDKQLREWFAVDCDPGPLQKHFAKLENTRLYVTTNYDDLLEKALAHRRPHVVIDRGKKGLQAIVDGKPRSVRTDELRGLFEESETEKESRPVLFKMHGSVDKANKENDFYLITEEDYVDFLGRASGEYIPPYIVSLMTGKDFLFLGYSLDDWNVRVILSKLVATQLPGDVKFYAILNDCSDEEQKAWSKRNVEVYSMDLLEFAEELAKYL